MINANDSDANGLLSASSELRDLFSQVASHAVNLFDHGLRQNLHLNTDFGCCNWPPGYGVTGIGKWTLMRDNSPKGPVAPSRLDSTGSVLSIQHTLVTPNRLDVFR